MRNLLWFVGQAVAVVMKLKGWMPRGLLFFYIMLRFASLLIMDSATAALRYLAEQLLSAEVIIHRNVELAIANSPAYGVMNLLDILSSLMVLYYLVSILIKVMRFFLTDDVASAGAIVLSLIFIAVLEWAAAWGIGKNPSFIPVKDGLFFLLMNLKPVLYNAHLFGWNAGSLGRFLSGNETQAGNWTNSTAVNHSA